MPTKPLQSPPPNPDVLRAFDICIQVLNELDEQLDEWIGEDPPSDWVIETARLEMISRMIVMLKEIKKRGMK